MCIVFCAIFRWSDGVSGQADIVKQIWAELPKHMSTPVAPLDEEMLSELAKVPAVVEGRDSLLKVGIHCCFFWWWLEITLTLGCSPSQ